MADRSAEESGKTKDPTPVAAKQHGPAKSPADEGAAGPSPRGELVLSAEKQQAIELLASGKSISATAKKIGAHRATVFRWLRDDAEFIAAYNTQVAELHACVEMRIASLADRAFENFSAAVHAGDLKASTDVLKSIGTFAPRSIGPQDVETIRRLKEFEAREKQAAQLELSNAVYQREQKAMADRPAHIRQAEWDAEVAQYEAELARKREAKKPK